ncbi:MAG: hypothetical protein IH945_04545, partial [Armatimonadetes bacterium]|nr:hypothetical protein [Armatimonadota bacterium]
MLGLVHVAWRALLAVAGALAGWAPVLLAAVWGGIYVSNCLNALTAPGVPIEYRYESEAGTVQVVAAGYWYDPDTGQAVVRKVRATAPDGTMVASVEKIDLLLDSDVPVIRIFGARIVVKRLADGSFDIAKFLPIAERDEPQEGAFRLVVRDATVEYSDERVPGRSMEIEIARGQADVADGSAMFRAKFDGETLKGEVGGRYGANGTLWAEIELDNAQFAPLLHFLNPDLPEDLLGEFAHVSAQSFTADGRLEVWSGPDEPTLVTGRMHLTGVAVTSPETLHAASFHADLTSDGTNIAISGTVAQSGLEASFDGDMTFAERFRLTGGLKFEIADRESLPPQVAPFIGPEVAFQNASFDGWIDTDGERFLLDGRMEAGGISFAGERTDAVQAAVRLSNDGVTTQIESGEWEAVPYFGAVAVRFEDGSLTGHLQTRGGRLEPIAARFGTDLLEGTVSLTAVISGTVASAVAEVYAEGVADLRRPEKAPLSLGVFNVRGRVDADGARIERLTLTGQNGVVTAQGSITWAEKLLNFTVDGGGVDLRALESGVEGLVFFDGRLSGTLDEPVASGRLEMYGVKAFERVMPQIAADWTADGDRLWFDSVAARAGTGQISGTGSLTWADRALEGVFSGSGIRLEEWLALDTVGAVSVEDGKLSGTLDAPLVSARLKTDEVFVFGVRVDSVEADIEADVQGIVSPSFVARLGEGELTGNAAYVHEGTLGFVNGSFTDLPLARVPISEDIAALGGSATGSLELFFDNNGLSAGKLTAEPLLSVAVNGTIVGGGYLEATLSEGVIKVEAEVGSTFPRFVSLSGASYDLASREVAGRVDMLDMKIEDLADMVELPTSDWPAQVTGILKNLTGLASARVDVSGTVDDPTIEVQSATLKRLALRGREAGEVSASGKRIAGVWNVDHLGWQVGDTHLHLNGLMSEDGTFVVAGDLNNFDVSWLNTFMPDVPLYSGTAQLENIDVSGTFDDPKGFANFSLANLGYFDGADAVSLPLSIDNMFTTVHDRQVDLDGEIFYQGLSGTLNGEVPFSSVYEGDEERRPMKVEFKLKDPSFSSFAPYISSLDEQWSEGTVTGSAT